MVTILDLVVLMFSGLTSMSAVFPEDKINFYSHVTSFKFLFVKCSFYILWCSFQEFCAILDLPIPQSRVREIFVSHFLEDQF